MKNFIASLDVEVAGMDFFKSVLADLCRMVRGHVVRAGEGVVLIQGSRGKCQFSLTNWQQDHMEWANGQR